MSPISNVSDVVRIPRLGKIRLGIKIAGQTSTYPKAVDYFVCPEEVQKVFGEKPKELSIMFPLEDPDQCAQQWLRCYSMTQGLVCIGDGETARAKVDVETGEVASHMTKEWVWKDGLTCNPEECPYYGKRCRRVLNLQFLLPQVPGLGVWQIDTSSFYSIVNVNSMIRLLKGIFGRFSMLPLTLALGPVEVSPPGLKKKTVYIMHIQKDIALAELARMAQLPPGRVLIPAPEVAEPPDDLFPEEVLAEEGQEVEKTESPKKSPAPRKRKAAAKDKGKPSDQVPEAPESESVESKGLTKEAFIRRVKAAHPTWEEDMIGRALGCPVDKWSEPWETAVDVIEQIGGMKI